MCNRQRGWLALVAVVTVLLALGNDSGAVGQGRGRGPGHGGGRGMGRNTELATDRAVFHELLRKHAAIERQVTELPNGVRTRTTAKDPEVAAKIRAHVKAMHKRLKDRRPLRRWDPLFVALFANAAKVSMVVKEVPGGVEVTETSSNPLVVRLIKAHAKVVTGFVERGFAEAHTEHPVPEK